MKSLRNSELMPFLVTVALAVVCTPLGLWLWLARNIDLGAFVFLLGVGCLVAIPFDLVGLAIEKEERKRKEGELDF